MNREFRRKQRQGRGKGFRWRSKRFRGRLMPQNGYVWRILTMKLWDSILSKKSNAYDDIPLGTMVQVPLRWVR